MNDRGWGWDASQIRQARLAEYLAQQPADGFYPIKEFYDGLEDQDANNLTVVLSDLRSFERRSLINLAESIGDIDGQDAHPLPAIRDVAADLRAKRDNRGQRRVECRDAMVHWLYSRDAIGPGPGMPATRAMLDDPRHGVWYAEPFTERDLDDAAAWLKEKGLVAGIETAQTRGPVRLYLTSDGMECAEQSDSDTTRYFQAQRQPGGGQVVTFQGPATGVQIAGDQAHQTQNVGANADQLRTMIAGLADLVTALVPDATDIAAQRDAALAAAQDGAVDVSKVRLFRDWVVGVVTRGATTAATQMITTGADDMVKEAMHLLGHI
jgi:hypothetical protein